MRTSSGLQIFCALLLCAPATAQTPRLLKDLVPGANGSHPGDFIEFFGSTLFFAYNGTQEDLWLTDGTAAGTRAFATLPAPLQRRGWVMRLRSVVLFVRNTGGPGSAELWRTDGTGAGTRRVTTLGGVTSTNWPVVAGDRAFFSGGSPGNNHVLWCSDGTANGTKQLSSHNVSYLTPFGDQIAFIGEDQTHGLELWKSDGTVAGTVLVKDINPGPGTGVTDVLHSGDSLYAIGGAGLNSSNTNLWRSDGTANGTIPLQSFVGAWRLELTGVAGEHVLVSVDRATRSIDLYGVHRTTGATNQLLTSSSPMGSAERFRGGAILRPIFGGALYTDGTPSGTVLLSSTPSNGWGRFVSTGSRFGYWPEYMAMWVTDGTASGTRSFQPGMEARGFVVCGGKLYFKGQTTAAGYEPWVLDLGASSVSAGIGLGDGTRLPDLTVDDLVLGGNSKVTLDGATQGAVVLLGLGAGWPKPIRFAPGAFLHLDPSLTVFVTGAAQGLRWTTSFPVPNNARLNGASIGFQAFLLGTAAARGFELSQGVLTRLGH